MIDLKSLGIENLKSEMDRLRIQKEKEEEERRAALVKAQASVPKEVAGVLTPDLKAGNAVEGPAKDAKAVEAPLEAVRAADSEKKKAEGTKKDPELEKLSFPDRFKLAVAAKAADPKADVFEWHGKSYAVKLLDDPAPSGKKAHASTAKENGGSEDAKAEFTPRRSVAQQAESEKERVQKEQTSNFSGEKRMGTVGVIESVAHKVASFFNSDTEKAQPNKTKDESTSAFAYSPIPVPHPRASADEREAYRTAMAERGAQGETKQRITLPPEDAASNEVATKKAKAEYANAPEAERRPAHTGMTDNPSLTRVSYTPSPQGGGMRTVSTNDGGAYPDSQWMRNPDIKPGRLNPSGKLDYVDALVQAVAHAESGGARDRNEAISRVGARGYMQVMPKTAMDPGHGAPTIFQVAKEQGVPFFGKGQAEAERLLGNQDVNKAFGRAYLGRLLEISDGDPIKALAAYNYGQGNVNNFMKSEKSFEQLPKETQAYVAKVAAFFYEKTDGQQLFPGAGKDIDTNRKMAAEQFNGSNEKYAQDTPNPSRASKDANPNFTEMSREMVRGGRWA